MGPSSVETVRTDKDEQIENLKICLEANDVRASQLRSRLRVTLDTLDALQRAHVQELDCEAREKQQLASKLDHYIDRAKTLEAEKDDLQDAVLQLVEKVQLSEDYSSWPRSRLQVTSTLEPTAPKRRSRRHANEDELMSYASSLITTLRAERDFERRAHQQTRQKSESRIAILEAQLAGREAELEACVAYSETSFRSSNGVAAPRQPSPEALTSHSSSRTSKRPVQPRYEADVSTRRSPVVGTRDPMDRNLRSDIGATQAVISKEHGENRYFVPTASSPLPRHSTRTENPLATPENEAHNPLLSRPRARSCPPSASPETTPACPIGSPSQSPSNPRLNLANHSATSETLDVPDFRHEQKSENVPLDDVHVKREVLFRFLARKRQARSLVSSPTRADISSSEGESLEQVVEDLRINLENTRNAAAVRERELVHEIERLEEHIRSSSLAVVSQRVEESHDIPAYQDPEETPLIDMYDGELSMELGTPLPPTALLPPPSLHQDASTNIDPPSIPLPISPGPYEATLPLATPSTDCHSLSPLSPTYPDLQLTNMERLEKELATANQKLRAGEDEYNRLQSLVKDMQLRLGRPDSGSSSTPQDLTL